jgi:hypothetical protein
MGTTAIKSLWKLSSLFWRKRNRKKHGRTPKEKTYLLKTKLDTEISTFRDTLVQLNIPHTPIPLGYHHRVDAKHSWLPWGKVPCTSGKKADSKPTSTSTGKAQHQTHNPTIAKQHPRTSTQHILLQKRNLHITSHEMNQQQITPITWN